MNTLKQFPNYCLLWKRGGLNPFYIRIENSEDSIKNECQKMIIDSVILGKEHFANSLYGKTCSLFLYKWIL